MTPPPTLDDLIRLVEQDSSDAEPLTQLATASATAGQVTETADAVLGHYVERARSAGCTWSEISSALGVSRQAVHKRFLVRDPDFSRYTDRAGSVVGASEAAARRFGHGYVGTEHLLLALYAEPEGVAARVLLDRGADEATLDAAVRRRVRPGDATGTMPRPLTPRARALLADGAPAAALDLGHTYVGTEHLLLAMSDSPGLARDVLRERGLDTAAVRAAVITALSGYPG